ncbi:hypothetical protein [uncultured Serinicoccus sp.]|uniref:hypothetical protein n=1 Tax=uncultured Serinicoccus sp. TaxID=735514 RepID=UPI00260A3D96|nr:hypothetical protein [uncultured Serinicoccus sp.]
MDVGTATLAAPHPWEAHMTRVSYGTSSIPALALLVILAGCGESDDVGGEGESANVAAPTEDAESEEESSEGAVTDEANDGSESAVEVSAAVDMDTPPEPDGDASADDHPGFEGAFRSGHQAGLYGREDYYDPRTVSEQGSFAGVEAEQAYRAGFALGLHEYQTQLDAQESEAEAAEEERLANYPVGEVLEGWDPRVAVSDFWELGEVQTCDVASLQNPCLDTWYTSGNTEVIAVGRLPGAPGPEPNGALRLTGTASGFEILESWEADDSSTPLPEWATPPS